jgi:hypothetical protein
MKLGVFVVPEPLAAAITLSAITLRAESSDTAKLDYSRIYSLCLDADVRSALGILQEIGRRPISTEDAAFKLEFENRFKYGEDRSDYLEKHKSPIDKLLGIYADYWRQALLNPGEDYDSGLREKLGAFIIAWISQAKDLRLQDLQLQVSSEDTLDVYLKKYIESFGYHTTGFGKTAKLYDLLVWQTKEDTVYKFSIHGETISAPVVFMDDFITLGWEEYATLGKHYPGGWATKDALYCVKKGYDLKSENFLISYLCHEARHFEDYKLFPKLKGADLEYRAKLTELSMLDKTLYDVISRFIGNANYESENPHPFANYCVVRDLSRVLFGTEFEKDMDKWRETGKERINNASYELLKESTEELFKVGREVDSYVR